MPSPLALMKGIGSPLAEKVPISIPVLMLLEFLISVTIVECVAYTEIDFSTYIQQVQLVSNGERNYEKISGDSGPLVYPAFHVHVFQLISFLTESGTNIRRAQYIWCLLSALHTGVIGSIFQKAGQNYAKWTWVVLLGRRVHSIFVLRLFNDPVAMLLAHLSIMFFQYNQWFLGCIIYSLGVATKMNVLLFAPALLWLLLQKFSFKKTTTYLFLCFCVQLLVSLPFLEEYPLSYVSRAFDLGRKFEMRWSVNWQMLSAEVFSSSPFALILLSLQVCLLFLFFLTRTPKSRLTMSQETLVPYVMYVSNFIGVLCARSLHPQFYCWYFHTLPFLLEALSVHWFHRIGLLLLIEYCWSLASFTWASSTILFICHVYILSQAFNLLQRIRLSGFLRTLSL